MARNPSRRPDPHKEERFHAQIGRAVEDALVGLCNDEVLQNISVLSVEPAPGNRLLVSLTVHPPGADLPKAEVLERLELARGIITGEVVRCVSRRQIPELSFLCIKATDPEA